MQKPLLQTDMRTIHGGFSISTVYHPQPVMVRHHIPSNRCHQNMAEKIERPKWVEGKIINGGCSMAKFDYGRVYPIINQDMGLSRWNPQGFTLKCSPISMVP
jgi:hypothetical protein